MSSVWKLNKKKKSELPDLSVDTDNAKDTEMSKPPPTAKKENFKDKFMRYGAFKSNKPPTVAVASKDRVGLLVTSELDKAIEECRTKVAQIVKGCRHANRRFR